MGAPKMTVSRTAGADVLVIVPARNEAANIDDVIADLRAHAGPCDILVVDDHSTDDTAARARSLGVHVVRLPYNLGIGGAVQTGFRYARRMGYRHALQFDGDGQHAADQIDELLTPLRSGLADVAIGSRFLAAGGFRGTGMRRVGMRMFQWLSRATSGIRITDTTSGFRAYRAPAIRFLVDRYPSDYPEVESITHLARAGFRIVEVPARMRERQAGTSSIGLKRTVYYLVKVSLASVVSAGRPRKPRRDEQARADARKRA